MGVLFGGIMTIMGMECIPKGRRLKHKSMSHLVASGISDFANCLQNQQLEIIELHWSFTIWLFNIAMENHHAIDR